MDIHRETAEELYKYIKSETIWKDLDRKRVNKFEKILLKKFPNNTTPKPIELKKEIVTEVTHQTLLQRLIQDEDENFDKKLIEENLSKNEIKRAILADEPIDTTAQLKRYYVEIHCNGLIKKSNYQIFKGEDIIEKDIITKDVKRHTYVYLTYIDAYDELEIRQQVTLDFINGVCNKIEQIDIDYIPIHYKQIWQNRTKL